MKDQGVGGGELDGLEVRRGGAGSGRGGAGRGWAEKKKGSAGGGARFGRASEGGGGGGGVVVVWGWGAGGRCAGWEVGKKRGNSVRVNKFNRRGCKDV